MGESLRVEGHGHVMDRLLREMWTHVTERAQVTSARRSGPSGQGLRGYHVTLMTSSICRFTCSRGKQVTVEAWRLSPALGNSDNVSVAGDTKHGDVTPHETDASIVHNIWYGDVNSQERDALLLTSGKLQHRLRVQYNAYHSSGRPSV